MNSSTITKIVVHCSDSPRGRGDNAATIHRWHSDPRPKGNGWSGIGYHAVILEDGTVENGRPHYWQGAHVGGHNRGSLGVCLIGPGGFTKSQADSLYALLREWCAMYPRAVVYGHCDLDPGKTCPGFNVAAWLEDRAAANSEKVLPLG